MCESGLDDEQNPQPAFARCLTCSHYLCKSCLSFHKKQKITMGHNIATLEEIKQSGMKSGVKSLHKKQHCEEHEDEVVRLFCNTCKKAICRDCALVKHREHDYTFVRELRPKVQELLEKLMTAVRAKETEFTSHKKYVEDLRALSKNILAACSKEVGEVYDQIIAQLEAHRSTLISELNDFHEAEMKEIEGQESVIALALLRFANSVRFTRQLLDNGDDVEVMSMSVQAQETLENLGKMMWNRENVKPTLLRLRVKFDPEVTNMKPFGTILHNIQPEDIVVKDRTPGAYASARLRFDIQLVPANQERGYFASTDALSATVASEDRKVVPVSVKSVGENRWSLSFVPDTRCLHIITIKLGSTVKVVEKPLQPSYLEAFHSNAMANGTNSDSASQPRVACKKTSTPQKKKISIDPTPHVPLIKSPQQVMVQAVPACTYYGTSSERTRSISTQNEIQTHLR